MKIHTNFMLFVIFLPFVNNLVRLDFLFLKKNKKRTFTKVKFN